MNVLKRKRKNRAMENVSDKQNMLQGGGTVALALKHEGNNR